MKKQKFCLLTLFFTNFSIYSLNFHDQISATMTFVSNEKKRIIINRGMEDGITENDIVQVSQDKNYIGKAILVTSLDNESEWVFYGPKNHELIKEKAVINLMGLYGKTKPTIKNLNIYQENSFLLNKLKIASLNKSKNYNQLLLNRQKKIPIKSIINLGLSPFSLTYPRDEKSIHFSFQHNLKSDRYQASNLYIYENEKNYSREYQQSIDRSKHYSFNSLIFNHFFDQLDSFSLLLFQRDSEKNFAPINYLFSIGPIGISYTLLKNHILNKFQFAYAPTYEIFSGDSKDLKKNPQDPHNFPITIQDSYWRHSFFIEFNFSPLEKVEVNNMFVFRPYHNISNNHTDFKDCDLKNIIDVKFNLLPQLSVSINETFSYDKKKQQYLDENPVELVSALYFIYNINLGQKNDQRSTN